MKIYQNPFRFDEHSVKKIYFFYIFELKNHLFLAKWPKCYPNFDFAKLRNFCPNFDFVFREFSRNSRKSSRNYENKHFRSHPARETSLVLQLNHFIPAAAQHQSCSYSMYIYCNYSPAATAHLRTNITMLVMQLHNVSNFIPALQNLSPCQLHKLNPVDTQFLSWSYTTLVFYTT